MNRTPPSVMCVTATYIYPCNVNSHCEHMHLRCSEIQSLHPYPVPNLVYGSPPRCSNRHQDVCRVQAICPRCNKPSLDMEVAAELVGEEMEFLDSEMEHTVGKHIQAPGSIVRNTARRHNARDAMRSTSPGPSAFSTRRYRNPLWMAGRECW